jgi:hypothetical protein
MKLHNETILSHMGLEDIQLAAKFQRWCRKNDIPQKISLAMFVADHKLLKHYYPTKDKCLEAIGLNYLKGLSYDKEPSQIVC